VLGSRQNCSGPRLHQGLLVSGVCTASSSPPHLLLLLRLLLLLLLLR
jgi:hypothetical protein